MPDWSGGFAWIRDVAGNIVRAATLVEEDERVSLPGGTLHAFDFQFDTPDLDTGVEAFHLTAGQVLLDLWWVIITNWDGVSDECHATLPDGYVLLTNGDVSDLDGLDLIFPRKSLEDTFRPLPVRTDTAISVHKTTIGDPDTVGHSRLYALIAEPAS